MLDGVICDRLFLVCGDNIDVDAARLSLIRGTAASLVS
jgi:hypothetical protein